MKKNDVILEKLETHELVRFCHYWKWKALLAAAGEIGKNQIWNDWGNSLWEIPSEEEVKGLEEKVRKVYEMGI